MKLAELSVEEITWLDHASWRQREKWEDTKHLYLRPAICYSYGRVVEDDPKAAHLILAQTVVPAEDKCSGTIATVRGAILRRRVILGSQK